MQPGHRSNPKAVINLTIIPLYIQAHLAGLVMPGLIAGKDRMAPLLTSVACIESTGMLKSHQQEGSFHVKSNLVYLCNVFVLPYFSHQLDSNLK